MFIRVGCHYAIPWGGLMNRIRGACRQVLARVIVSALIVAFLPAAFLVGNSAAAAATSDPIVGQWNVTYGAPAVVNMTLSGGEYTETASTPVVVVGSSCSLSAGTVIATFALTGPGTYAGQHGLWSTNDCSFDTWTDMTLSLSSDGNTLTAVLAPTTNYSGSTVIFTKSQHSFTFKDSLTNLDPGTQDTHATDPTSTCNPFLESLYRGIGYAGAEWARAQGGPTAADLLEHFLGNYGTPETYSPSSLPAMEVLKDPQFKALNTAVVAAVVNQLDAGKTTITLSTPPLQTITLGAGAADLYHTSGFDLYWGFRGTQYLTVTGTGSVANGMYSGTITYTIGDNYGLPTSSNLNFGAAMRYLQVNCGDDGGAHYFQDFITVSQTFTHPAGSYWTSP
jgi:hypothetical protein